MNHRKQLLTILSMLLVFWLSHGPGTVQAEQVWNTNKSNGCKFSIPVHSKDIKIIEADWNGPCKDNLAEGEGPILLKFYRLPNDKAVLSVEGTMTMATGMPNGKASLRWNIGATFEGEYAKGERVRGILRFGDESYDGDFYLDEFHGKGIYRFKNGEVYDGDWAAGVRQGFGKLIGPDGKVKYEGEWKNNYPATDPAVSRSLKGFLNIPWGTKWVETEKTMKARPGNYLTMNLYMFNGGIYYGTGKYDNNVQYMYILGKFNNEPALLWAHNFEDQFFLGKVVFFNTEQNILSDFETVKKDLADRYGAPSKQSGKFMDSSVLWEFQEGNFIGLKIERLGYEKKSFPIQNQHGELREILKRPFNLTLYYGHGPIYKKIYSVATITNKTDY